MSRHVSPMLQSAIANQRHSPKNHKLQQQQAQEHSLEVWSSLDALLAECNALRTSPSHALLLIRNKDLVARAVKDHKGLLEATSVLSKDVREYSDKLAEIHKEHVALVKSTNGNPLLTPDLTAGIMAIGEAYSNWITSYQLVVIPSAFQVTGFFDQSLAVEVLPQTPALSI